MQWLVLIAIVVFVVFLFTSGRSSPAAHSWREVRVDVDESSVSYRDQAGQSRTETDGCNGCIVNRAEELQRKGFVVEDVRIGRHNTGEL